MKLKDNEFILMTFKDLPIIKCLKDTTINVWEGLFNCKSGLTVDNNRLEQLLYFLNLVKVNDLKIKKIGLNLTELNKLAIYMDD